MNVGKSDVTTRSMYGNWGRLHMRLNMEPLEEVDSIKYLGSQVAAHGGSEKDVVH